MRSDECECEDCARFDGSGGSDKQWQLELDEAAYQFFIDNGFITEKSLETI